MSRVLHFITRYKFIALFLILFVVHAIALNTYDQMNIEMRILEQWWGAEHWYYSPGQYNYALPDKLQQVTMLDNPSGIYALRNALAVIKTSYAQTLWHGNIALLTVLLLTKFIYDTKSLKKGGDEYATEKAPG